MESWQLNAAGSVGALLAGLIALLAFVRKETRSSTVEEQVNAIMSALLIFALIVVKAVFNFRWGVAAVLGVQALWLSVFFMVKSQVSRVDFLLLAVIWPLFFGSLLLFLIRSVI